MSYQDNRNIKEIRFLQSHPLCEECLAEGNHIMAMDIIPGGKWHPACPMHYRKYLEKTKMVINSNG